MIGKDHGAVVNVAIILFAAVNVGLRTDAAGMSFTTASYNMVRTLS